MEDQNEELHVGKDYKTGFNNAYLLAKHNPELAATLRDKLPKQFVQTQGFKDGFRQYQLEQEKQRYPDWLSKTPEGYDYSEPEKDKDMDKDDYDLER